MSGLLQVRPSGTTAWEQVQGQCDTHTVSFNPGLSFTAAHPFPESCSSVLLAPTGP